MAQTDTRPAAPTGLDSEPDFIELPDAASTPRQSPSPPRSQPRTADPLREKPASRPGRRTRPIAVEDDAPEELTWQQWIADRLTGDEGAGYGISLVLHLILIAILAIPIIRHVQNGPIFSTVLTESVDNDFVLSEPLDTELAAPELEGGLEQFQLPDLLADESRPITDALFPDATAGDGIAAGAVAAGMQRFVPDNAVTAGSFTAWTTPTFSRTFPRAFGEPDPQPGDSPRPKQPYYITIQIKVPEGRRRYPLSDLSGTVVGTDDYEQQFPQYIYILDRNGERIRPRGSFIPVTDGVVHIDMFVPGTRRLDVEVKDTINISSKMLNEEQTLELVFEFQGN